MFQFSGIFTCEFEFIVRMSWCLMTFDLFNLTSLYSQESPEVITGVISRFFQDSN